MDFESQSPYVDVCLDYALAYSERELSSAFHRTLGRVSRRPECAEFLGLPSTRIFRGPDDYANVPHDIEHGLLFFIDRNTRAWPKTSFVAYFNKFCEDMAASYVPFRCLSKEGFQDAMRLRVYQDSMNIIAGRSLDGTTNRAYSLFVKFKRGLSNVPKPAL
jgi:hypothetical protein